MSGNPTRRRYLAGVGAGITAVAGCTEFSDSNTSSGNGGTEPATGGAETASRSDLDLREANVVAVAVERTGGDYRFEVTLLHDDDGEEGYADWWQVETRNGERLGRRELLHAHGTREFTRSTTVSVPDAVPDVVVRGHDQTHGYGGQAMIVTLQTGETEAVRQGADPQSFSQ